MTIHKVQGLTQSQIVLSLDKVFSAGMAYVALSRAKSLNGVFIIDKAINPRTIFCDKNVSTYLESMPQLREHPLLDNCVPSFSLKNVQISHNRKS